MDIKKVIKEKGYSVEAVAKEIGVSRATLFQNISRNPTVKTLQKIADVIGCDISEFFIDKKENESTLKCPHCGKPLNIEFV